MKKGKEPSLSQGKGEKLGDAERERERVCVCERERKRGGGNLDISAL